MDIGEQRFLRKSLYTGKKKRKNSLLSIIPLLTIFLLPLSRKDIIAEADTAKPEKQLKLTDLSGANGGFDVFDDGYYIYDNYEFTLKKFSFEGSLIKEKSIRGIGPGETTSKEATLFTKNSYLYILDPIARKIIQLDKGFNFVKEFKLTIGAGKIKGIRAGFIASVAEIGTKYKRSLYLLNETFETQKILYSEEGKSFEKKIETNELYITFDVADSKVIIATQSGIKLVSIDGQILDSATLDVRASMYTDEELSRVLKHIPEKLREYMVFDYYPRFSFTNFLQNDKVLVITGEMKDEKARAYVFKIPHFKILKEILWDSGEPLLRKGKIYSLKEEDEHCILNIYDLSKVMK